MQKKYCAESMLFVKMYLTALNLFCFKRAIAGIISITPLEAF